MSQPSISSKPQLSPLSFADSPFPQLKPDFRYRGVYERAGFDINRSGDAGSAASSKYSPNSPASQNAPFAAPFQKQASKKSPWGSAPTSPLVHSRPFQNSAQAQSSASLPKKTHRSVPTHGNHNDTHSHPQNHIQHKEDFSEPYIKPFVPDTKNPRQQRSGSQPDRNKKQLKLQIKDSANPVPATIPSNSPGTSTRNSPFDSNRAGDYQSPSSSVHSNNVSYDQKSSQASAHSNPVPYPVDEDLKGLNVHGFDPRAATNKPVQIAPPAVEPFVPVKSGQLHAFQESHHNKSIDSNDDTSFRFDSGRQSVETAGTSEDYENFLKVSSQPAPPQRASHLSTISSIISKHNDGDANEDEVEKELQRQLESIKSGNRLSLASRSNLASDSSFVSAQTHLRPHAEESVPKFTVSEANETTMSGYDVSHERSYHTSGFDDSNIDVQSQSSAHTHGVTEPFHPQTPSANLHDFELNGTPETIKPLSPKKHFVEHELKKFTFDADSHDQDTAPLNMHGHKSNDDEILSQNPTPSEFEAFPKSVINPNYPAFRNSLEKSEPGTGPCRGCNSLVEKGVKGPQKGVYSKSGELSGQWHRGCFKCSYAGCLIKFDKKVTPYVLLDNPFCHHHYHTLNNTLCGTCNLGIEGGCIENELKQKWHPHCLKCTRCLQEIGNDYYLIDNKAVCEKDARAEIDRLEREGGSQLTNVEKRRTRMLFIE